MSQAPSRILTTTGLVGLVGLLLSSAPAWSQPAPTTSHPLVVPSHLLRSWDPVTIFFADAVGPEPGGEKPRSGLPEDHPERWVHLEPDHPGAFSWIDRRTLQFRPADPWPPLSRFTWSVAETRMQLTTLMSPPLRTVPQANAIGLAPVDAITLVLPEPIDPAVLRRAVSIELRPLPGVDAAPARWLRADDFDIKVLERNARTDPAQYVLQLHQPIGAAQRALVHFQLGLDQSSPDSFFRFTFSTAEPFRVSAVGCAAQRLPITPDGVRYSDEQAIRCAAGERALLVDFSAAPRQLGPVEARNLIGLEPPVDELSWDLQGQRLVVRGAFHPETAYHLTVRPVPLRDTENRPLDLRAPSEMVVFFARQPSYLRWQRSEGIVERFGPQMVPAEGRGFERMDLRIFKIDPLTRDFWPFPDRPVAVNETQRPPGPGEETPPSDAEARDPTRQELARRLLELGSPPVSEIDPLPLSAEGGAARFGVDLRTHLEDVSGQGAPGTYLVGLRRLDASSERSYMRVQVTDLSLSTVEEPYAVRFVVTSLATGKPVEGAQVRIEGVHDEAWTTLGEGRTDGTGAWRFPAPGRSNDPPTVRRLVVRKGDDVLVLDAAHPPDRFADNQWNPSQGIWLQWAFYSLLGRGAEEETVCHIFSERPIYRPDEPVHIKGYVRARNRGRLSLLGSRAGRKDAVWVNGPGDLSWRFPIEVSTTGSFYYRFDEDKLPTGSYVAGLDLDGIGQPCQVTFSKEAYRLPTFEVQLHAPDRVPLDRELEVRLDATYYAGGPVVSRPVQWRVTQFPYTWSPQRRTGFFYSSDGRYSRTERFVSSPRLDRVDATDAQGTASLALNPAIEPTAQPRTYVVEATVTGADDQTVTAVHRIVALPSFVLGLKVPRYLEQADSLPVDLLVVGPDGQQDSEPETLLAGQEVTVRLLNRQWHSHLRAGDFSDGVARYATDVVDVKVQEQVVTSTADVLHLDLPLAEAGVYVVELEAHDRLGRAQVVSVDLYAGGAEPVTWQRPSTPVFEVTLDAKSYRPRQTAHLLLQSPFQNAEALVVIEAPDGPRYSWLPVRGGSATFDLPIENAFAPRVPVHFLLQRGRLAETEPQPTTALDLGKPTTMGATAWVQVEPVDNRVEVELRHPPRALPGQEVPVEITLRDPEGAPLSGEVTLWLVDQAVLALATEQRLDPLPDLITAVSTHLEFRDTRNLGLGRLPFAVLPGGEQAAREQASLFDRTTVRRDFRPVPFYEPSIRVPADGHVTVQVKLPDNLTNFAVRAKAASGAERFGFAKSEIAVRLPVTSQPALPRFVRPGDTFTASAILRVVEGDGGAGSAEAAVEGLELVAPTPPDTQTTLRRPITLPEREALRFDFDVRVPTPTFLDDGTLSRSAVTVRVAAERASDGAADAFELQLPLRDDRDWVRDRQLLELTQVQSLAFEDLPAGSARPGSIRRRLTLTDQPALLRMAAGLDFLAQYPYGCTEQRLSQARALLALRRFQSTLGMGSGQEELDRAMEQVFAWLPQVITREGLVSYWPGSTGYVALTAWTAELLLEAQEAGYPVDQAELATLTRALQQALRSDYGHFIRGEQFAERAWALQALSRTGSFDAAYASELERQSQFLDLEGVAQVLLAFERGGRGDSSGAQALRTELHDGVVVRLFQGNEVYSGLNPRRPERSGLILPSESRTVAEMVRALAHSDPPDQRLQLMVDALVRLGRDDGWGTTNANAAALLALTEIFQPPIAGVASSAVTLRQQGREQRLRLDESSPVAHWTSTSGDGAELELTSTSGTQPIGVLSELRYLPAADGSQAPADQQGLVVEREQLVLRADDHPLDRHPIEASGQTLQLAIGDVVEEHVRIVNPREHNHVAITAPLAAGMEPLNPHLETAPPEATPRGRLTLAPTYVAFLDDQVAFYYDTLPQGSYDFYFRTRATTPGEFIQPGAKGELMYDDTVRGSSPGARVAIVRPAETPENANR